jgi:hypothetical protein
MENQILISKTSKRVYGQEYQVNFLKNGVTVYSIVCFGNDLRYIDQRHTKEFIGVKPQRLYYPFNK